MQLVDIVAIRSDVLSDTGELVRLLMPPRVYVTPQSVCRVGITLMYS